VNRGARIAVAAAAAGAGLVAGYWRIVRPWAMRWGATEEEAARPLPGDAVVEKADFVATRAITIKAPSHDVWPWLMQTRSGRAGWYTYDRFDNAGVPSATQILPELQQLAGATSLPWWSAGHRGPRKGAGTIPPDAVVGREGEYTWLLESADQHTTRPPLIHCP
jgi:hypothetical protein